MPLRVHDRQVRIEPWADSDDDLDLLKRINAPEMTVHLGGSQSAERVLARHRRYLRIAGEGTGWMFRIVLVPELVSAGSVGYWDREWSGDTVYEIGWAVLPPFQGRGIAIIATAQAIAQARVDAKHRFMHAFPSIDNVASNAVCQKLGFALHGECDFEFPKGNPIRSNDWSLDLAA